MTKTKTIMTLTRLPLYDCETIETNIYLGCREGWHGTPETVETVRTLQRDFSMWHAKSTSVWQQWESTLGIAVPWWPRVSYQSQALWQVQPVKGICHKNVNRLEKEAFWAGRRSCNWASIWESCSAVWQFLLHVLWNQQQQRLVQFLPWLVNQCLQKLEATIQTNQERDHCCWSKASIAVE